MTKLKNLTFKSIQKDAKNLKLFSDNSYHVSYPEFIKFFKNKKQLTKHDLIIGSHFVYAWMPTIIKIDLSKKSEVLNILNNVKSNKTFTLGIDDLKILKCCINNSTVGVSKLLHFISPKKYAIWDSRILRYTTGNKSQYNIGKENLYLEYLSMVKKIALNENYKNLHQIIESQLPYKVSPLRVIELVMFETDKRKNRSKKLKVK